MIDRYQENSRTVFIADRGFETYNVFAHVIEKESFFLVRVKDLESTGILSSEQMRAKLPINRESFDETVTIILTRKQTKDVKANPDKFRFLPAEILHLISLTC